MKKITATHKWLMAGFALIAISTTLLLQVDTTETGYAGAEVAQELDEFTHTSWQRTLPPVSTRQDGSSRVTSRLVSSERRERLLDEVRNALPPMSAAQSDAIGEQVSADFNEFFLTLAGDARRQNTVRNTIEQAVADVATITAALQSGLLSAEQLQAIANPNHVLDRVADILDPAELTHLETYMEDKERQRFLASVTPQVEISAPALNSVSRELLLDTLFAERYAAMNPYGIGEHSAVGSNLEQQLNAIAITLESLRMSLPPAQFEIASQFLQEQATAISTVRNVFSELR